MKKFSIAATMVLVATSALFTACGGSSSSSNDDTTSSVASKSITVVDSYVVNATVKDNNGNVIGYTDGSGKVYTTVENIAYPLYASGGFIDVNQNGKFDNDDMQIPSTVEFITNKGDVISPLTTLIASGVNAQRLATLIGVDDPELFYSDPIANDDITLEKANQIAYAIIATKSVNGLIYNLNVSNNSDLPMFSYTDVAPVETGTLEAFANVAIATTFASAGAQSFINQVVSLDVQSVDEIESALVSVKKTVVAPVVESVASLSSPADADSVVEIIEDINETSAPSTEEPFVSSTEESSIPFAEELSTSSAVSSATSSSSYVPSAPSETPNFSDFTNPSVLPSDDIPFDLPNFNDMHTISESNSSTTSDSSSVSTTTSDLPQFSY